MNEARTHLDALITRLRSLPDAEAVRPIVGIAEQLRDALDAHHMEGIRFRAFSLTRLVNQPGAPVGDEERRLVAQIKAALETAGLPLRH